MSSRPVLSNVLKNIRAFFEKEMKTGRSWFLSSPFKRLQSATGLTGSTLKRLINEGKEKDSDKVIACKPTARCKMDSFDCAVIRRTVYECNMRRQHMTLNVLKKNLEEKGIRLSKTTLYRTVMKMGFRFYKGGIGQRFMKERTDIVSSRHFYLRNVKRARLEEDLIVYVDETWVNTNHCMKGEWSDSSVSVTSKMIGNERGSCKFIPSGKGKRLIVLDAGCRNVGLIPGVGEMFVARSDTGDYHSEMNHQHFFNWWKNTLLPALPAPSTIVVDNASYHSVLTDDSRSPTTATKKDTIKVWLREKRIHFTDDMLKAELIEIVRRNKPKPKYIIDELALEAGHKVLRLPPRHCELNPIELVWAKMKGHVARKNSSFKLSDTMALFEESRCLITPAYWNSCEDHVINKIEEELWRIDGVREDEVAPVVISIGEADDTDDEDDLLDEDEDDNIDEQETEPLPHGMNLMDVEKEGGDYEYENDEINLICKVCGLEEPSVCGKNEIDWICCDACEGWMHCVCVKLTNVEIDSTFFCIACQQIFRTYY